MEWGGPGDTDTTKYLGVTLDRTLSYKTHIHKTKMKVACAAPVWGRSAYAHLLNPELNQACRDITECLKPTNVEN